ncbi:hypothetical protein EB796_000117 [Bugula neritina]|uniref:RNF213 n=1 Tax=Bugula neritina TaxID=10212 RepID=A0A7J7KTV0_BUGNE|nr:hypothetical protein EB796_000117 [Bugula neritina]
MRPQWQIVLKYLDRHEEGDGDYKVSKVPFASPMDAIKLLIKHCGLRDPTWSELRHYVYFLSNQLEKVEKSPYCSLDCADILPGFRTFVIKFMIVMAQDFATRSLKIAEDTPGLHLAEIEENENEDAMLNYLRIKRTWESGNHPYLFFNEDGDTFTPLGFFVQPTGGSYSLMDCQTNEELFPNWISQELKRALDHYHLPMSENFNNLKRLAQLTKLRNVMVKNVIYRTEITEPDGSSSPVEQPMFGNHDDPDPNYVLTMDNAKKILAIHQRLRYYGVFIFILYLYSHRVDIPVIIMGETGCGKTKLIEFMSKLQVPTALKEEIKTMIIVKIHGGTTEEDIIRKVEEGQQLALQNQRICQEYAAKFDSGQVILY